MSLKNSLQAGVNLGGWISQYPAYDHSHFQTFITAADIQRIAGWGFDHVRLPVDYPVLVDESQPGSYRESGFEYIQSCLSWCRQQGLGVILDLHKAPGFAFDALDQATLFDNPDLQQTFLDLWSEITRRFAGQQLDSLAFELLNEIVLPDSGPWNALVRKAVALIRAVDPERLVLVGGNYYNSADQLQNLERLDDPHILYTFHFYLPLTVTHQKAPWLAPVFAYNQAVDYPGCEAVGLEEFVKSHPHYRLDDEVGVAFDQNYLREKLQPAVEFAQRTGEPVYCGEFGVYEGAALPTRLNWTGDFVSLLNEYGIGRAYWTYKNLDFGLVDQAGEIVDPMLVTITTSR